MKGTGIQFTGICQEWWYNNNKQTVCIFHGMYIYTHAVYHIYELEMFMDKLFVQKSAKTMIHRLKSLFVLSALSYYSFAF